MVFREFLFFFALALTTYDALQNSPPKISDVPRPVPFFDKGSLVSDWYKGELSKALPVIFSNDVSFVMYYAPWDAESQHAKHEFDKAAQIMFKHVHFAAINCWQPGSECRLHHVHISVWPIIIVHTNLWKTLIYNGPKDYMSMVKFLHQVIKPMTRLNSNDSLYELISVCDAVVVGFIPMENDTNAYNVFYNVALKKLEIDPFRDMCFGIVTSEKLASNMGVTKLPHLRLMLWNDTLEYPINMMFNEDNISNWLFTSTYMHATWVMPSWHKSTKMQAIFNYGPVLILFSPRNLFNDRTPSYDLLRETALEYNNCKKDLFIKSIIKLRKLQRRKYKDYERNKKAVCKDFKLIADRIVMKITPRKIYKLNNVKNVWLNKTSCKNEDELKSKLDYFSISDDSYLQFGTNMNFDNSLNSDSYCVKNDKENCLQDFKKMSSNAFDNYDILESVSEKEDGFDGFETSMLNVYNDPRSAVNLMKNYIKDICANVELALTIDPQLIPVINEGNYTIEGLRCRTNHSLSFIAIDSLLNPHFAESLGIDITRKKDKTAIVILDNKHESQYLLDQPLGELSLREFIYNFTMRYLPRNLRMPIRSDYTHYYGSDKTFKNELSAKNNASGEISKISHLCKYIGKDRKYICIKELNTSVFSQYIMQKNKALLVVFCGKGAGNCGGLLTLSLLKVVRSLWEIKDHFEVAKIDASVNDLPWEYTVSKFPTLVFFPTQKKENSRSYPDDKAITVEGILAFILTGLETPVRLHAQVLLCNNTLDDISMKKCLSNVRQSVVGLIGKMLRHWRRSQDIIVKNLLLRRLQSLRTVAINLGALNTTKVPLADTMYKSFTESILTLTKIWRVVISSSSSSRQSYNYDTL